MFQLIFWLIKLLGVKVLTFVNNLDQSVLLWIQATWHNAVLDQIMIASSALGTKGLVWIVIALALMINRKTRFIGFIALAALLLATAMGEGLLKHLIQRPRPYDDFPSVHLLIAKSTVYSFPSGHATSSFAVAAVLARYLKKYAVAFWSLAALIAFSRLYLFMHYPTDIIAGILLGLICGEICIYLYEHKFKIKCNL
jgi:undecaprenyl-diphosphatase